MNKLGSYPYNQNDDLCSYDFSFTDNVGTHVGMSFRAEPEWDLHVVFQQFRKFLIASGHDVENDIGELNFDEGSYEDGDNYSDEIHAMTQAQLLEEILRQRRIEFAFEGHRFFDQKRLSRDLVKGPHYNNVAFTDVRILPAIPQGEIDGNPNLKQNFGY